MSRGLANVDLQASWGPRLGGWMSDRARFPGLGARTASAWGVVGFMGEGVS
ncbi:Hypothetical protein A7982_11997 [Minicystis rosea]|nr:Hypothetical protein A7982_11997 [Minicystis rosea]